MRSAKRQALHGKTAQEGSWVIGHHLILTGYGHWLPNDPRGSMSPDTYSPKLASLARAHFGRRKRRPSLEELKDFHRKAQRHLGHDVLWFGAVERQALTEAIAQTVRGKRLTCYACAVLRDHVHLLIRRHRLSGKELFGLFKQQLRRTLLERSLAPQDRPVFSADVCVLYKSDPGAVRNCIRYIQGNSRKHGLKSIACDFLTPYDNWPFHRDLKPPR
jgi:REP element-mobilizing transposase RayT